MAKPSQNLVKNADGSIFRIVDGESVEKFLSEYNNLRYVQTVDEDGSKTGTKGAPLFLTEENSVTAENTGRPFYKARPRSGYDKYFNNGGFVNPASPEGLQAQGIGKLLAKLFEVAYDRIGTGGSDAAEMQTVLDAVEQYRTKAPLAVAQRAKANRLRKAIEALGADSDEAKSLIAQAKEDGVDLTITVPVAAVEDEDDETAEAEAVIEPELGEGAAV